MDATSHPDAVVAVDTSPSVADPSGMRTVIDLDTRAIVAAIDLGGQPDSVHISPDMKYIANRRST